MTAIEDSADESGILHVGDKGVPLEPVMVMSHDAGICPYVQLRTHKARRLASLTLIRKDLGHVRAALALVIKHADTKDNEKKFINRHLWFSAVVTYGKCFTSGSGRTVTLKNTKDLRGVTAEQKSLHEEMMETRHNYVAHAGATKSEQVVTWLFLHPDPSKKGIVRLGNLSISMNRLEPTKLVGILRLVERVIGNVHESLCKARESVLQEANESPIDDLYERAIFPKSENPVGVEQRIDVHPTES